MSSILAAVTLIYSKWDAPAAELLSHFRAVYVVGSSYWRLVVVLGVLSKWERRMTRYEGRYVVRSLERLFLALGRAFVMVAIALLLGSEWASL